MKIWLVFGVIGLLVLAVANLWGIWSLSNRIEHLSGEIHARRTLPCQAIPVRFAMDNPECANKLLASMNVTNVRFWPQDNIPGMIDNHSYGGLPKSQKLYNVK